RALARPMAVRQVRRQELVERDLELAVLAAALVEADIGRDPVDPAGEGRAAFEAGALVDGLEEDVLHDLLGVGGAARDTVREPVDACGVPGHKGLEGPRVPGGRARREMAILDTQRGQPPPRESSAA